jgi:predicted N-acetyltransferase YhbS
MNIGEGGTEVGTAPGTRTSESDLRIRPLQTADLSAADAVRRLAFGTFLGLPDPMTFRGDASPVRTRYLTDPSGSYAAIVGDDLVGSNFLVDWGSVGFFGPLSVRPDQWGQSIAQRLLEPVLETFAQRGTQHVGLFTFGHSAKHLALYQKFGFWPRFPTAIMAKPAGPPEPGIAWSVYSEFAEPAKEICVAECRELTDTVYRGLDLGREIRATAQHRFGDTILVWESGRLAGFAVCHCGAATEAGSGSCYVKFGAVPPGADAESRFSRLLAACEAFAAAQGLQRLVAGVNTARREAYRQLLARGFRTDVLGLAMDRPDEAIYNRPGAYVIDDWR